MSRNNCINLIVNSSPKRGLQKKTIKKEQYDISNKNIVSGIIDVLM